MQVMQSCLFLGWQLVYVIGILISWEIIWYVSALVRYLGLKQN